MSDTLLFIDHAHCAQPAETYPEFIAGPTVIMPSSTTNDDLTTDLRPNFDGRYDAYLQLSAVADFIM